MSILIGAVAGLVLGLALIAQYWSARNKPGVPSIWAPLFLGPMSGAFVGAIVFLVFKV